MVVAVHARLRSKGKESGVYKYTIARSVNACRMTLLQRIRGLVSRRRELALHDLPLTTAERSQRAIFSRLPVT